MYQLIFYFLNISLPSEEQTPLYNGSTHTVFPNNIIMLYKMTSNATDNCMCTMYPDADVIHV